jgi:acyl-CoA synthetase (NDP forming)
VALVGASDDPSRPPGRPLHYLRRDGWQGRVYPVNPRREVVLGERAWPSLAELPEVPDHVFVLTGTDTVVELVGQCGELGVPVATILAGGFAEAGAAGSARTRELVEVARRGGVRLLGPNAIGVVDTRTGMTLTANAAFVDGGLPTGRTFLASQSGSLIGALVSRGRARGIGFATLVSVGSESDLTLGEICAASLDDPGIDGYALFLETLANADDLRDFALAAAARGRPVVAYKLGRSSAGADLAVTHTGALAGEDDVASAFLAECGIARVDTFEGLLEGVVLAPRVPIRPPSSRPPRVGVLTATGGGAAMVVDQLGVRGVEVPRPSAGVLARLEAAVGFDVPAARVVDLTLRGTGVAPMSAAIEVLRSSGELDLLVQVVGSSAVSDPEVASAPAIAAARDGVPVAVFVTPDAPDALARLGAAGVPAFRTPEACADSVAALVTRRPPRARADVPAADDGPARTLDEEESGRLLDRVGVPRVKSTVVTVGAPTPLPFPYPVAVKALVEGLAHKSDVGGVVLDVGDDDELTAAMASVQTALVDAGMDAPARFLVQPMVSGVAEVLVGFRRDPDVGPLVLVAPGGVLAELAGQRSIRLAPVDRATAREMVAEVPSVAALVAGHRGKPAADPDALADAIAALSHLALDPRVLEAEVNPLLVGPEGAVAVDALARVT